MSDIGSLRAVAHPDTIHVSFTACAFRMAGGDA